MLEMIHLVLAAFTTVLGSILIVILHKQNGNRGTRLTLGLLLGCQISLQLLAYFGITATDHNRIMIERLVLPLQLATASMVFLHIKSFTQSDFKLKEQGRIHIVPFLIGCVFSLALLSQPSYAFEFYIRLSLVLVIFILYVWGAQRLLWKQQEKILESRSEPFHYKLVWLNFLINLCYVAIAIKFLDVITGPEIPLMTLSNISGTVGILALSYLAMSLSPLLSDTPEAPPPAQSTLSELELSALEKKLMNCLRQEEMFLRPKIRLEELAQAMGTKGYRVTEVIRKRLQTNFFDLINGLRVERAKQLLVDPRYAHMNLLGIAGECGFNSKSVFNDAFKRFAGMTPSEFRKQSGMSEVAHAGV